MKLFVVLSRASAAVGAHADADITSHGLTPSEFGVMELLFHKGPAQLGEVQRRILVSSGGITYLVDRLVKRGLVERRENADDRRARYAALTPKGERLLERIFPPHAGRVAQAVSGLTAEEQEVAIRLLRKLGLAAAERANGEGETPG